GLDPNEFDLWKMRIEQYFLMIDYSLWEVILNGDSPPPTRIVDGVIQIVAPTTVEQRNKADLEKQSLNDLFNNLKIYEAKVNGSSPSSQNTQNIAFVSSNNTDSINELVIAASISAPNISAASSKAKVSTLPNVNCLSDAMIYSFFASQSNSPWLDDEDLKLIDPDDLEEMDLKWQMAMLTMRARRFLKRTKRNLDANGTETIGFDMSKVKCYNCHRRGHFVRECRSPRDNRNKDTTRRTVPVENEIVFEKDIQLLKFDVMLRDNALAELRKKIEKVKKERNDLKLTLNKLQASSKNLSKLLESQVSDKTSLGFDSQVFNSQVFNYEELHSHEYDNRVPKNPENDRYKTGEGYHVVPPPYTGTFLPPKPDLVFTNDSNASESVANVFNVKSSINNHRKDMSKTHRHVAPIIKDWVSDSKDESEIEFVPKQREPSFVTSTEHVKSSRESVKKVEHHKQTKNLRKNNQKSRGHKTNRNNKACFVCRSLNHLIKDYGYYEKQMVQKPMWKSAMRVNHQNSIRMTHPHSNRNVVPTSVLTRSRLVSLNAARPVPTAVVAAAKLPILNPNEFDLWKMRIEQYFLMTYYSLWEVILNGDSPLPTRIVDGVVQIIAPNTAEQRLAKKNELKARGTLLIALPDKHQLKFNVHKDAKSLMEAIEKSQTTQNIAFVSSNNTDSTNESVNAAPSLSTAGTKATISTLLNQINLDDLEEMDLKWQMAMLTMRAKRRGHFAKECRSPRDNRNKDTPRRTVPVEADEEPTNYALMANALSGSSSSSGSKNKTLNKSIEDMLHLKGILKVELNFNLFSVSQMCDKKNSVLFIDIECVVLSSDYKLPDENHVLLRVPRENNMYNVDLKNIVHSGDLLKGKQHRASCKSKPVSSVSHPLQMLHMDLFGPTFVKSLNKKSYYLVVTDDYSRILVTKPHNKTPYELLLGRSPSIGFMRPFGCSVTIYNTLDPLEKFDGKADKGFLVGYSVNSKAFRVFTSRTKIVPETLHINFLGHKPNVARIRPKWLFDIDTLTKSMRYQPVVAGNQPNDNECIKENLDADDVAFDVKENENDVHVSANGSDKSGNKKKDEKPKKDDKGKSLVDSPIRVRDLRARFEEFYSNSTNRSKLWNAGKYSFVDHFKYPDDPDMPEWEDIVYLDDEEDVAAEVDLSNLETNIHVSPIPIIKVHKDHPVNLIIGDLNSALQTRSMTRMVKEQGGLHQINDEDFHTCMFACFLSQEEPKKGHTQEEGIDYDEVFARVARIEAIRLFLAYASFKGFMVYQMDVKSDFLYGTIKEEDKFQMSSMGELNFFLGLQVKQKDDGIFISQDKYVAKILRKFGFTNVKSASTLIEIEKPLLKDPDYEDVDVHIYKSMIRSLICV
nr:hypothetical protein [Tanacetum cinerariifolium]